ncbi:DNA cytosine methyltransferase [Aerococcus urinaeequi]|uniref:DNA cytosine methyltransferase n=1 Tax=Aerococcus urinaeequi TaxID=51665 RepID=UPI003ED98CAF
MSKDLKKQLKERNIFRDMNTGYSLLETFVGAGGSHIGFMKENFRSLYVNDFVKECLQTLEYNNSNLKEEGTVFDNTPIEEIDSHQLINQLQLQTKELDVMFGGVVCKGFSLAGERSPNDIRNTLYRKQLELVKEFLPKISIVENVPGIVNSKILDPNTPETIKTEVDDLWLRLERYKGKKASLRKRNGITDDFLEYGKELRKEKENMLLKLNQDGYLVSVLEDLTNIYNDLGYKVQHKVLNAAWYGAATKRERVIIVAIREDIQDDFEFPKPEFMSKEIFKKWMPQEYLNLPNPKTVNDALDMIDYDNIDDVDNLPMKHQEKTIERFKYIPEGESIADYIDDLPEELKISKFYSRGSTMRLAGNKPSPTLVPGHSNFPVHPKEHRSITVREAATITGFPLEYKFIGTHSKRCEHVGNAVPPALAQALAKECNKILDRYYR